MTVKTQGLSFIRAIIAVKKTGFCLGLLPEPCVFACVLVAKTRTPSGLVLATRKHEKKQGSGNSPMQNPCFYGHNGSDKPKPCVFTVLLERMKPEPCVFAYILGP